MRAVVEYSQASRVREDAVIVMANRRGERNTHNRSIERVRLLANIGVVVGLFFVGNQIIQDRDLERVEMIGLVF